MADGCEQAQRVAISLTHVEYTKGTFGSSRHVTVVLRVLLQVT